MSKRQVGVVKALFRYPVKSMLGENLEEFEVTARGVLGDRAYALREKVNGRVVSAKKWPNLFEFHASYDTPPTSPDLAPLRIVMPDGRSVYAADPGVSATLSAVLGRKVTLERADPNQHTRAEIDPGSVFGDVPVEQMTPAFTAATLPDSFGLPHGTFFDAATIHVIASGSLSHLEALVGDDAHTDPRRFRPNILVETDPRVDGFIEDEWLTGTLEVGASVKIVKLESALRCVMTTHAQEELPRDLRILRTAAQHHSAKLGVFASIGAPGRVAVGDPVILAT